MEERSMIDILLWTSIALQLTAAILALRLIPLTGRAVAWIALSIALILMSVRRTISLLYQYGVIETEFLHHILIEWVALVISLLMVIGVYRIRGIFTERLRSEEQFRIIYENSMDGMVLIDACDGSILDVNPAVMRMLGYTKEELIAKPIWALRKALDIERAKERFQQAVSAGKARFDDTPLYDKRGRAIDVEIVTRLIPYRGGRALLSMVHDIRERKAALRKLEEQLDELQRYQKVMVGRELRMKELREENEGLRQRIVELVRRS